MNNFNVATWKRVSFSNRHTLPDAPGIYAVCVGKTVYYIGKSVSLFNRWRGTTHHRYFIARLTPFAHIRYIEVDKHEITQYEENAIEKIEPPWNKTPEQFIKGWVGAVIWHMDDHNKSSIHPPIDWIKVLMELLIITMVVYCGYLLWPFGKTLVYQSCYVLPHPISICGIF